MKIIFTKSKNPKLFSKLIAMFERCEWTHVFIETDLIFPGTSEPLVLHSSWNGGCTLSPKKELSEGREIIAFEDHLPIDWKLIRKLIRLYDGADYYGFGQILGSLLRYFHIKEPGWLIRRYEKESYCSKLILLYWVGKHKEFPLDIHRTGPGDLFRYIEKDVEIIQV